MKITNHHTESLGEQVGERLHENQAVARAWCQLGALQMRVGGRVVEGFWGVPEGLAAAGFKFTVPGNMIQEPLSKKAELLQGESTAADSVFLYLMSNNVISHKDTRRYREPFPLLLLTVQAPDYMKISQCE